MPTDKASTTFRLSDRARRDLDELAGWHRISMAAVIELAIGVLHRCGPITATSDDVRAVLAEQQPATVAPQHPGKRPRGRPRKASKGDAQ